MHVLEEEQTVSCTRECGRTWLYTKLPQHMQLTQSKCYCVPDAKNLHFLSQGWNTEYRMNEQVGECVKHTWPCWAARRAMQPLVTSYTPDELPHVTRTCCLTAARLEGPAPCDCPFRLPSLALQQSTAPVAVCAHLPQSLMNKSVLESASIPLLSVHTDRCVLE